MDIIPLEYEKLFLNKSVLRSQAALRNLRLITLRITREKSSFKKREILNHCNVQALYHYGVYTIYNAFHLL